MLTLYREINKHNTKTNIFEFHIIKLTLTYREINKQNTNKINILKSYL